MGISALAWLITLVKPRGANRFKDPMLPQVLATPVMILFMENAALAAIRPYLDAGESAVSSPTCWTKDGRSTQTTRPYTYNPPACGSRESNRSLPRKGCGARFK